jgi:hypothetical protein
MPEMTPEERLLCALSHEEPDRVPLYDLVDHKAIHEHSAGRELTIENAGDVIPLSCSRALDTTRIWLPSAPGKRVDAQGFEHERKDWWNEWVVKFPFSDMVSLKKFVSNEIDRLDAWNPAGIKQELADLLEWKRKYAPTVIPAGMAAEALTDVAIRVGFDQFIYLQAEEPELAEKWINANHQRIMRHLQAQMDFRQVSPICWIFGDMAYKDRLIFSPAYLRANGVFQRIAEITGLFHDWGCKVIFHSDGCLKKVVNDLIDAKVDAIAPIETSAGMHLSELKAEFGDRVSFVGGLDLDVIARGTPAQVRQLVLDALKAAAKGGGLVLGSSSEELYEALPYENILTMLETVRQCGRYPIGQYF